MRIGYCREIPGLTAGKQREELAADGCELVVCDGLSPLRSSASAGDSVVVMTLGVLGSTPSASLKAALVFMFKCVPACRTDCRELGGNQLRFD